MDQDGQIAATAMIESFNGWWHLAGVDSAVSDSVVDWLTLDARPDAAKTVSATPKSSLSATPTAAEEPSIPFPTDIETVRTMIANGAKLPGNHFGSACVVPVGPANGDVMIISDLPDQDELSSNAFGSGAAGMLLTRMLAAVGIALKDCYWTGFATSIPATGDLPETELDELTRFVRHQIGLVEPKSIILLGSLACKALLGEELLKARQSLQNINHDGSNMATLTTFHPRTLNARPAMKALAWKDLQMFAKRDNL